MIESASDRERYSQQASAFVNDLITSLRTYRSYPDGHPSVMAAARRVQERLATLADGGFFTLGVGRHALLANGEFIERNNHRFGEFAVQLSSFGIVTLTFSAELSLADLKGFTVVIARSRDEVWAEGGMQAALTRAGVVQIMASGIDPSLFTLSETKLSEGEYEDPWDRFLKEVMAGTFPVGREKLLQMLTTDPDRLADEVGRLLDQLPPAGRHISLQSLASIFAGIDFSAESELPGKASLETLLRFVLQLPLDLRKDFLLHLIASSGNGTGFSEILLGRLPQELILESLNSAQSSGLQLPPLVLKLLRKLAATATDEPLPPEESPPDVLQEQITTLLKQQDLEDYLPAAYRDVLFAILEADCLPKADLQILEALAATLDPDYQERHTAEVIVQIMKTVPAAERAAGISANLSGMVPMLLAAGDLVTLADLAEAFRSEGVSPPFADKGFTADILSLTKMVAREQYPLLRSILLAVGPPAIVQILSALADEENRSLRWLYLDILQSLGPEVRDAVIARLGDSRWFYVRNLLLLLGNFPDEETRMQVRRFTSHPHPKVRTEAIRTALLLRDPAAERILFQELASGDRERKLAAVLAAAASRSITVSHQILGIMTTHSTVYYDLELKSAAAQTLAAIGDPQVLPELELFLCSRNLFHPSKHLQLKLEVVSSLRRYSAHEADTFLGQLAAGKNRKIAQAAVEALRAPKGKAP